eukprot:20465-Heterococcus_DN1.PRE.1
MSKPPRASIAKRCRSSICVVQTNNKKVQATLIGNALTFVYRIAVRPDTHPTVGRTALEKAYRKLRTIARLTFSEFQRACEATLRPILGSVRVSAGLAALSKVWRQLYVESAAAVLQLNAAQQKEKAGVSPVAAVSAASDKQVDAMDVSESPAQAGTASMSSSSGLEALLLAAAAADKDRDALQKAQRAARAARRSSALATKSTIADSSKSNCSSSSGSKSNSATSKPLKKRGAQL